MSEPEELSEDEALGELKRDFPEAVITDELGNNLRRVQPQGEEAFATVTIGELRQLLNRHRHEAYAQGYQQGRDDAQPRDAVDL